MSYPYERLFRTPPPRPPPPTQNVPPPRRSEPSLTVPTASASSKKNALVKKPKPYIPFHVRPRFRFDLPDPPMDLKMLLGPLSTSSYATPHYDPIERTFKPPAVPADPSYALRANLAAPTASRPSSAPSRHHLTADDDALLQSVMNTRPGSSKLSDPSSRRSSGPLNSADPRPLTQANAVSNAPWMRRMSYDEYAPVGRGRASTAAKPQKTAAQQERELLTDPKVQERRRSQMLATFGSIRKPPVHPDYNKGHLKPVAITPVFPDFASLLKDYIAVEFDKDEVLTLENRPNGDAAAAKESVRSMASISLAENNQSQSGGIPRKFLACYTPTDETIEKRKRKRGDTGESENEEEDKSRRWKKRRKIHFLEEESYEWFGEYSIREGKFGGIMSRSCFAVEEMRSEDGKGRVARFSRIGTSWKLARRPFHENTQRLGKEGLRISRDLREEAVDEEDEELRLGIVSQAGQTVNGAKKEVRS